MQQAAALANALGIPRISVIEFGVGTGGGLLAAEAHKKEIERSAGIGIDLFGFDLGSGLPAPVDYRDHPYHWQQGFFEMDVGGLRRKLKSAELVIGDVAQTIPTFFETHAPSPIGAIFVDLDYYSSTSQALKLLDGDSVFFLPRIMMYFDDMIGPEMEIFHEFGGELLAIKEFNEGHADRKIAKHNGLWHKRRIPAKWNDQIFVFHDFTHDRYSDYVFPASYRG
jgi:hypothetical protein